MQRNTTVIILALITLLGLSSAFAQQAMPPAGMTYQFSKEDPDGDNIWDGTLTGDTQGAVQTVLLNADQSEPVWRVAFEGIVTAGEQSFRAHVGGTLDTTTGAVRMTGVVTAGSMLGATVDWQGQMVDQQASRFEGTITVTPAGGDQSAGGAQVDDATAETRRIFEAYSEAHDVSYYAEDATFTDMTNPSQPIQGREGIAAMLAMFYGGAFEDGHSTLENMLIDGNRVMLEFTFHGTHTGPLEEIPATQRSISLPMMSVYHIEDGQIQWARLYYDSASLLRQLGVIE